MKSIGIVTDSNSRVAKFIKDNLIEVLGEKVEINNYYLKELKKGDLIEDSVVLLMIKERAIDIKKYLKPNSKIIVIRRTFLENRIYKLFTIPEGTDTLVVNDNKETTLETMSLFYELGINHLNLIPYDENKIYKGINVAVTPAEDNKVPKYIDKIIDLGDRYLDVSTFIEIISALSLEDGEISKNLIKYSEKIVTLDGGIRDKYKELLLKNEELDTIINLSRDGIISVNNRGTIKICNKSFKDIFELKETVEGKNIKDIFKDELSKILKSEEMEDEVFKYKNKYLNVNKKSIYDFGKKIGTYFNIQEITYIRQLEQNLSKKIREQGQIARYTFDNIKTNSKAMMECVELAKKISKSDLTVLIIGESGTGKELMAQSIHNNSNRSKQPFIAVNCAAMPENLLESELFGYEGGAFTGALKEGKKGLFEQANNGTIFLDEIGDMPILLQTKLLRVLQERQVMRIGSKKIIDINVRVIAATNRDLPKIIREGNFREDLYYRINVLPINIPPLRERKDDIVELLQHFIGKKLIISEEVNKELNDYHWPGNIRELQNTASYISLMCNEEVKLENLPFKVNGKDVKETQEIKSEFNEQIYIIKSKCNMDMALEILKVIYKFNELHKTVGRNNLLKILNENKISVSEGEVRKILAILNELEFINSKVGRKGSNITETGIAFLKSMNKI